MRALVPCPRAAAATFCRAAQEPQNAHSHLLSMVLGNSETVPVSGGKLKLGQWQVGAGARLVKWQLCRCCGWGNEGG